MYHLALRKLLDSVRDGYLLQLGCFHLRLDNSTVSGWQFPFWTACMLARQHHPLRTTEPGHIYHCCNPRDQLHFYAIMY